jgi:copper homeostasis protein
VGAVLLELIASSVDECSIAIQNGANRIELLQSLSVGGVTPSLGLVIEAMASVSVPIVAMVRPRGGDFVYTDSEFRTMIRDVKLFAREGVGGIVTGALLSDGNLDRERMRALRDAADGRPIICHRCFDQTPSASLALEQLIELGFARVLTAGHSPTALAGATNIQALVQQARQKIEILPGGGVRPSNAEEILRRTGATQLHASVWS